MAHQVLNRRQFLGTAATATAAGLLLPTTSFGSGFSGVIDINGVKVGAITYSYRSLPSSAEELLGYLKEAGMDTVELMGGPAEEFAGAPKGPGFGRGWRNMSEEERAEARKKREEHNKVMSAWRKQANMKKFEELGQMYADAGVQVDILKLGDPRWNDDEIDYAFTAAKAMGARGISFEISDEAAERIAPFADKHQMFVGMHNHTQVADEGFTFDKPLSFSKYNMLNLDIGHYVAGLGESPLPVIEKYHERITHLHLKDRKSPANGQDNVVWGEGDTPIAEALQLLRDKEYPITAMIELEYEIPEGSSVQEEMIRCVEFCKKALS